MGYRSDVRIVTSKKGFKVLDDYVKKYLRERKKELTEEQATELSQTLSVLKKGDIVKITFYYSGHYVVLTDKIQLINLAYKYISVSDNKIPFEDILEISRNQED